MNNRYASSFLELLKEKQTFLYKVYIFLILELCVTFFIVYYVRNHPTFSDITKTSFLLYFVLSLAIISCITFIPMPIWLKVILFTMFAILFGGLLHQISYKIPREIVDSALKNTIAIFVIITLVSFCISMLQIDISWLGIYLLVGLLILIVVSFTIQFTGQKYDETNPNKVSKLYKFLLIAGLLLFGLFILWNTTSMLSIDYKEDFVSAAIDLYLGFINTFTHVLGLSE